MSSAGVLRIPCTPARAWADDRREVRAESGSVRPEGEIACAVGVTYARNDCDSRMMRASAPREESQPMGQSFKMIIHFKWIHMTGGNFVAIDKFGTTLRDQDLIEVGTMQDADVHATVNGIEKQDGAKIAKLLKALKIKPIDPNKPKKFFAISWHPEAGMEQWFAEIQAGQAKRKGGDADNSRLRLKITAANEKFFDLTDVKVLRVASDPRMGGQDVQFEFAEMKPAK
jgi:hypothetical protein